VRRLIALLQSLIITTISAAAARKVLGWLGLRPNGTCERLVFEIALGLGLLGMLVFLIGMSGLLYAPWIVVLVAALAAFAWRELAAVVADFINGIKSVRKAEWSVETVVAAVILIAITLPALIRSLAPPLGDDWDSLAYHLAIPKLFLKSHSIHYIDFSSHSNFPFTWEMLYTLGMSIGSVSLAKLFHFGAGVVLVGAAYCLGRRYFSNSAGRLAALIVAGIPLFAWESPTAYIDLATALYSLLVVYALLNSTDEQNSRWAIVAGLMAGLAAGTKMTALLMIAIVFVWVLSSGKWKTAIIVAVLAVIIAAPWYVKSYAYTGNPVFPFAYGVFGGKNWSAETAKAYRDDQVKFGKVADNQSPLMLPWNLTFRFARFNDYAARAEPGLELPVFSGMTHVYLSSTGPILLALLPVIVLGALKRGRHRPILAISLVMVAAWYFTMQNSRYLLPALVILAPVMAYSSELLKVRKAAFTASAITGIFTAYLMWSFALPALPVALGMEPQDSYLEKSFNIYRASKFANEELPDDAAIALFGETRGFYLDRGYIWADPGHNALIPYDYMAGEPKKLIDWLKARGVGYVLINEPNFPDYQEESSPTSAKLIGLAIKDGYLKEIFRDQSGISIFKLTD